MRNCENCRYYSTGHIYEDDLYCFKCHLVENCIECEDYKPDNGLSLIIKNSYDGFMYNYAWEVLAKVVGFDFFRDNLTEEQYKKAKKILNAYCNGIREDKMIQFELNNWAQDRDFPYEEPFITWMDEENFNLYLTDSKWVNEQGIGVVWTFIDMSINFCITTPEEWVKKNCPNLFKYPQFIREKSKWGVPFKEKGLWFARLNNNCEYEIEEE